MSHAEFVGKRRRKNRSKNKVCVVFDADKRKEFLSGFRKRNLAKKEKAKEQLLARLKEEKKKIKQESQESYKKLVKTMRPIPELEKLLNDEFETEDATVKVVELSADSLAEGNQWIGRNKPQTVEEEEESSDEHGESEEEADELPGMELEEKKKGKSHPNGPDSLSNCMSKKEINKMIRKEATSKMQNSKVFRAKNKLEQRKNKKKAKLLARKNKSNKQGGKDKKKFGNKMGRGKRK